MKLSNVSGDTIYYRIEQDEILIMTERFHGFKPVYNAAHIRLNVKHVLELEK